MIKLITPKEYLMGRSTVDDLPDDFRANMATLLFKVNKLMEEFGEYRKVNSGFRTQADQTRINPTHPNSAHTKAAAVDLEDNDGKLKAFIKSHVSLLDDFNLYCEDFKYTVFEGGGWVHFQVLKPASGNRFFIP